MRYMLSLVLIILQFTMPFECFSQVKEPVKELYNQAIRDYKLKNYTKAISHWEEILSIDSEQQTARKMILLAEKEIKRQVTPMIKSAQNIARSGKYGKSRETYLKVLALIPKDDSIQQQLSRLDRVLSIMTNMTRKGKVPRLLRIACGFFIVENKGEIMLESLVYARQICKDTVLLSKVKQLLEIAKEDYSDLFAEKKFVEGFTLVEQYLNEALDMIYESNHIEAIKRCKRVLLLDKDNVTALMRIGSAYYAYNQVDNAEKYWNKVLKVDPKNNQVKKYLAVIKNVKEK